MRAMCLQKADSDYAAFSTIVKVNVPRCLTSIFDVSSLQPVLSSQNYSWSHVFTPADGPHPSVCDPRHGTSPNLCFGPRFVLFRHTLCGDRTAPATGTKTSGVAPGGSTPASSWCERRHRLWRTAKQDLSKIRSSFSLF